MINYIFSGGSGHYTSYALDDKEGNFILISIFFFNLKQFWLSYNLFSESGQWYEYNDEKVHEVDASLVENLQAYILFYVKKELRLNLNLWFLENIIESEIKYKSDNFWFQRSIIDSTLFRIYNQCV